jgi:hypothetical protein
MKNGISPRETGPFLAGEKTRVPVICDQFYDAREFFKSRCREIQPCWRNALDPSLLAPLSRFLKNALNVQKCPKCHF